MQRVNLRVSLFLKTYYYYGDFDLYFESDCKNRMLNIFFEKHCYEYSEKSLYEFKQLDFKQKLEHLKEIGCRKIEYIVREKNDKFIKIN